LPADSRRILHAVRTHWGIENALHWCLDVTFGEDASPIRLRNAALNFSFLRRLAINLFRTDTSRAISLPKNERPPHGIRPCAPESSQRLAAEKAVDF
jgi:hypothetical protein